MRSKALLATALALALAAAGLTLGPVGPAAGAHDARANFTVSPVEDYDHRPGIDDASYMTFSVPPEDAEFDGFRYMGYSVLVWEEGTLGNCGITDNEVAGIDRGNDDPGTEIDHDITENIENVYQSEDKLAIDFWDPEDEPYGKTVHFNVTDEFVSHVTDCRGNPDEPGWYQLTGTINGTTWSGEYVERTTTSHYFYICECSSYDDAVDTIGPPPSRPTPTETTDHGTTTPSSGQSTPNGTATDGGGPTASETTTRSGDSTDASTSAPTATDWASGTGTSDDRATPARWARRTVENGPGFGSVTALLALVAVLAALAARRP